MCCVAYLPHSGGSSEEHRVVDVHQLLQQEAVPLRVDCRHQDVKVGHLEEREGGREGGRERGGGLKFVPFCPYARAATCTYRHSKVCAFPLDGYGITVSRDTHWLQTRLQLLHDSLPTSGL